MSTLIKSIDHVGNEGVSFTLTEKAALNGTLSTTYWYVSWDRIGKALFKEQYSDTSDVRELRIERGEDIRA